MPLVKAVCPNCGANLEVDNSKDAAICIHCGAPYIVEKAIQITNNTYNNIQNLNVTVTSEKEEAVDEERRYCINSLKIIHTNVDKMHLPIGLYAREIHQMKKGGKLTEEENAYIDDKLRDLHDKIRPFTDRYSSLDDILAASGGQSYHGTAQKYTYEFSFSGVPTKKLVSSLGDYEWESIKHEYTSEDYLKLKIEFSGKYFTEYVDSINDRSASVIKFLPEYGAFMNSHDLVQFCMTNATSEDEFTLVIPSFGHEYKEYYFRKALHKDVAAYRKAQSYALNSGCYIATCVYGSYDCPQVWALRRYRDYYLKKRILGRAFIRFYYAISPKLIRILGGQNWFRKIWKRYLDKKVSILKDSGYKDTPYND